MSHHHHRPSIGLFFGLSLTCLLLMLAFLASPQVHADDAASLELDLSQLPVARTWPGEQALGIVSSPTPMASRELKIDLAPGARISSSLPHDRYLLVIENNQGTIYDTVHGKAFRRIPNLRITSNALLSPDGLRLAATGFAGGSQAIVVGYLAPPRPLCAIPFPSGRQLSWMAFADHNTLLVCWRQHGQTPILEAYDVRTGSSLWKNDNTLYLTDRLWALTPQNKHLAVVTHEPGLRFMQVLLMETASGRRVGELNLSGLGGRTPHQILNIAISP